LDFPASTSSKPSWFLSVEGFCQQKYSTDDDDNNNNGGRTIAGGHSVHLYAATIYTHCTHHCLLLLLLKKLDSLKRFVKTTVAASHN